MGPLCRRRNVIYDFLPLRRRGSVVSGSVSRCLSGCVNKGSCWSGTLAGVCLWRALAGPRRHYAMVFYALALLPHTIRHKGRVLTCSFIHSLISCA
jgi:hypothetical protein